MFHWNIVAVLLVMTVGNVVHCATSPPPTVSTPFSFDDCSADESVCDSYSNTVCDDAGACICDNEKSYYINTDQDACVPYSFDDCSADASVCDSYSNTVCDAGACICDNDSGYYTNFEEDACEFSFGECDDADKCEDHPNTECFNNQCICNMQSEFFWNENVDEPKCIQNNGYDEMCDEEFSVCTVENSACLSDGDMMGNKRCLCLNGFVNVPVGNSTTETTEETEYICARVLTQVTVPACKTCEDNEGTCFDEVGDGEKTGCKCRISRTGDDCEIIHVNVTCNVTDFAMIVCYRNHPNIDFEAGSGMYVSGYGNKVGCMATTNATEFKSCNSSYNAELILPLMPGERDRCGTEFYPSDLQQVKFQNKIIVRKDILDEMSTGDIVFDTFCGFDNYARTGPNGVGINVVPGNGQGQDKEPALNVKIKNSLGQDIPENVALRLGDKIRLQILLVQDGTYDSLRVERCMASSSGYVPDPYATTVDLLVDECPTDNGIIHDGNTFRRILGRPNEVQTGLFPLFKLRQGNVVHLHCTVKLCFNGESDECDMKDCNSDAPSRRKRQADDGLTTGTAQNSANISREIILFEDPKPGEVVMDKAMFGVLIGILAALLVIFTVAAGVLFIKLRKTQDPSRKTDEINLTHKPQRFAMPRIARPTLRI